MNPKCSKFVFWGKYEDPLEVQYRVFVGQFFVPWLPYATAGGAGNFSKLTSPTHPSILLFCAPLCLIIRDDHSLIRESWILALITHLVALFISSNVTRLVMILLCLISPNSLASPSSKPPQSKLLLTQVPFQIYGEVQYIIPAPSHL